MDKNLHTHTFRCQHATGDTVDYARVAVENGMTVLGMSDHSPFPETGFYSDTRMNWNEMGAYCEGIKQAQAGYPQLRILSGLELDYFPTFGLDFYHQLRERWKFDYFIGGVHYIFDDEGGLIWRPKRGSSGNVYLKNYIRQSIELMETGLLDYYTHPDIIGVAVGAWTNELESGFDELIQCAVSLDIPLEINAYGIRKGLIETPDGQRHGYPWRRFWELAAKRGVKVVIGADAHSPESLTVAWDVCSRMLDELGLRPCNAQLVQQIIERS